MRSSYKQDSFPCQKWPIWSHLSGKQSWIIIIALICVPSCSIASNPDKCISRTFSDGQLITGSITGINTPLKNTEFVEDIEIEMKPSLDDDGINR